MARGRLTPPRGPLVDANGYLTAPWAAYMQALADRVAELEARLAPPAPPPAP